MISACVHLIKMPTIIRITYIDIDTFSYTAMYSSAILHFSVNYRFNIASDRSIDRLMGFSYTPKC